MRGPCREPSPSSRSTCSARCETLTTSSVKPARASRSIRWAIKGRPATGSRGLGTRSVSGRMRSPRPAARIIAFKRSHRAVDRRLAPLELAHQARKRRELAIALGDGERIAHEARGVLEIAGLAVAEMDAREDAQHLEVALQPHPFEITVERGEIGIDRQPRPPGLLPVARAPVDDALLLPAQERVAQERDDVVAD